MVHLVCEVGGVPEVHEVQKTQTTLLTNMSRRTPKHLLRMSILMILMKTLLLKKANLKMKSSEMLRLARRKKKIPVKSLTYTIKAIDLVRSEKI